MESSNNKIQSLIEGIDLQQVVATAETVSGFIPIPFLPQIMKVLRILICVQPAAAKAAGLISDFNKGSGKDKNREMFDTMWQIAIEDGVITEAEKAMLLPHAKAAGISASELERMVYEQNKE